MPIQNNRLNYGFVYFNCYVCSISIYTLLGAKRKTKDSELSDRKRLLTGACSLIGWKDNISKRRISCTGGKTFGNVFG